MFYANEKRKQNIVMYSQKEWCKGDFRYKSISSSTTNYQDLIHARRIVDKNGIFVADVVIVPLEDGDSTMH